MSNIVISNLSVYNTEDLGDAQMIMLACKVSVDGQALVEANPDAGAEDLVIISYAETEDGLDLEDYNEGMVAYRLGNEIIHDLPHGVRDAVLAMHLGDKFVK